MGQKTNSNIFRLNTGFNREWKSKYKIITSEESSLFVYNDLQYRIYIKQFLNKYGLIFHDYKAYFNNNTIYIYISYFVTKSSLFYINTIRSNQKISLKKSLGNKNWKKKYLKEFQNQLKQSHFLENSKFQKRLHLLKKYKKHLQHKDFKNTYENQKNRFIEQLIEGLNLFTNKKYHLYLNLQHLNSGLTISLAEKEQGNWKKKLLLLKRYSKFGGFKETLNILLIGIKIKNSAQLISTFVAKQLSQLKRQSYFFIFFKRALNLFIYLPQSNINGIKIVIKGRFNGAPRARKRILTVGKIPIQNIAANIDYHESTAFSSNGTFGVKVWICEK